MNEKLLITAACTITGIVMFATNHLIAGSVLIGIAIMIIAAK